MRDGYARSEIFRLDGDVFELKCDQSWNQHTAHRVNDVFTHIQELYDYLGVERVTTPTTTKLQRKVKAKEAK